MVPVVTTTTRSKSFGVSIRQLHPSSSSFMRWGVGARARWTVPGSAHPGPDPGRPVRPRLNGSKVGKGQDGEHRV